MYTRSYRHVTAEERETVSLGLAHGQSLRAMARILGRAPSPLSREVARNTTRDRPYRACTAQSHATARAHHPRRVRKLLDPWLWQHVTTQLTQGCSPEQIAGRLRRLYPGDMRKQLSAETIYAALYVLPRGALRTELLAALRQARKTRRPRARGRDRRGQIPNMTPITARPAEVANRTIPGHWEGDLLKGARNGSAVGTLVERTTRLVLLAKMGGTDAVSAYRGFTKKLRHVPAPLRKTLTYDRGKEMADHERLARSTAYYQPRPFSDTTLTLMRRIDELHLQYPFAGARMLRDLLRQEGHAIGRRQVVTLMRRMGITAIYRMPRTSQRHPAHRIYPYLLRQLTISRPNQVWAADITYIPMRRGFVYLFAVLDWASRRVLAWRLSTTLTTDFCLDAVREAITQYGCPEIFNTDQGCQFTSQEFTGLLKAQGIQISMDGKGCWRDNVFVERLWKSLKYEEVYLHAYDTVSAAQHGLERYLRFYNQTRPHQALAGQTPDQVYEDNLTTRQTAA